MDDHAMKCAIYQFHPNGSTSDVPSGMDSRKIPTKDGLF